MKLELYMFETCPFCRKVLNEIERQGRKDIEFHDIRKSQKDRLRLTDVGGKEQVPCLFIDGNPMYESDDIVNWLKENPEEI